MEQISLVQLNILNWRYGSGDKGFELRTVAGSDELCFAVKNDDNTYSILSPNKDYWLSIQPDGSLQVRTSSNPPGPWERFTLENGIFTECPKDGITRDPQKFAGLIQ